MLGGAAAGALLAAAPGIAAAWGRAVPPVTPRRPKRIEQLGRVRIDDYAWLKPANWQAVWRDPALLDPATRAYLEEEDRYCAAVLTPTLPLRTALVAEMKALMPADVETPPELDGPWAYLVRYAAGAQHPRYLRRPRDGGPETLLLDAEARAAGHAYLAVKNAAHSPDQRLFAWAEDTTGAEKFTIQVKDIATGALAPAPPESAYGDFAFSPDSQWLFWTWRDPDSRPARIYRRPARGGADVLVYQEPDHGFLTGVTLSPSRRYLFIRSWNDVTSEVRFIPGDAPEAAPVVVAPRVAGVDYDVVDWRDRFVIRTNADGAEDFKLMWAPLDRPHPETWQAWIAWRPGHYITEVHPFAASLAWIERIEGNGHVMAIDPGGAPREPIRFDEAAYAITVQPSEYAGDTIRLTYESPVTPRRWLACDLAGGGRSLLASEASAAMPAAGRYVLKRMHATAADGALVPITVLHAAATKLDGSAPLLLTGYGAYGISYETVFSAPVLAMVNRGWVWAVAHVRGGGEKGWRWFEQARRLSKKTSFTDFITCAETLIATGHGRAKRIVLHGYSAGGLLVGAANNMRPDLWGGVIGQAPFVDMLNTMSDASHPLVPLTRPVWGDPLADPRAYDYIASYSPYDNVRAQPYPPVLATTAVGDDRVGFWEPAKWIARLRAKSTSGAPMLLHTEMSGGHLGAAGRYDELEQMARMYGFAIWAVR